MKSSIIILFAVLFASVCYSSEADTDLALKEPIKLLEDGNFYYNSKKYKKAIESYAKALNGFRTLSNDKGQGLSMMNIAMVLDATNADSAANHYFEQSFLHTDNAHDSIFLAINYSDFLIRNYEIPKSVKVLLYSLELSYRSGFEQYLFSIYFNLSTAFERVGDDELSYMYLQLADNYADEESKKKSIEYNKIVHDMNEGNYFQASQDFKEFSHSDSLKEFDRFLNIMYCHTALQEIDSVVKYYNLLDKYVKIQNTDRQNALSHLISYLSGASSNIHVLLESVKQLAHCKDYFNSLNILYIAKIHESNKENTDNVKKIGELIDSIKTRKTFDFKDIDPFGTELLTVLDQLVVKNQRLKIKVTNYKTMVMYLIIGIFVLAIIWLAFEVKKQKDTIDDARENSKLNIISLSRIDNSLMDAHIQIMDITSKGENLSKEDILKVHSLLKFSVSLIQEARKYQLLLNDDLINKN